MPKKATKKADATFTPHISIACSGDAKRAGEALTHALGNAYLSVPHDSAALPEWTAEAITSLLIKLTQVAWAARRTT